MKKLRLKLAGALAICMGVNTFMTNPIIAMENNEVKITNSIIEDDPTEQLNTFTINYYRQNQDFDDWNFWIWPDGKDGAGVIATDKENIKLADGKDYTFIQTTYKVPDNKIGVIPRKGDWAEQDGGNRYIEVPVDKNNVEVWLVEGHTDMVYTDINEITFETKVEQGYVDSNNEAVVTFSEDTELIKPYILKEDGTKIYVDTTKVDNQTYNFILPEGEVFQVNKLYKAGADNIKPKDIEMRKILDGLYYSGDDLGLTYGEMESTFKVWAPTATEVELVIYNDEGEYNEFGAVTDNTDGTEVAMTRNSTGVWSTTEDGNLAGQYYMYKVTFADGTTNYAVDPYARAVSANGQRTAIVDLAKTNPPAFLKSKKPPIIDAADAIIYELHVRDFSIDSEAPFEHKGTFEAFTETGLKTANGNSVGIDHLKELGVTHVHLLPSYDYASVNEMSDEAQFNWGYDPQNYNVPEGSYSSDATIPTARIEEFKDMVAAMHDAGIRVVMDVVYNHTYSVEDGPFEKIVPNYFYRTNDNGTYANGSGCGNEVASERPMVRKYIADSIKYWAQEYDLDGFRFDLMGLIDTQTMRELTNELRTEVDPDMLIYGEPWQAGGSILPGAQQTIKGSQKGEDFKVFNDEIRGAIKGDSDSTGKGFATGAPNKEDDIIIGVKGAIDTIAQEPTEVISYVTAHDNLNLWDKVVATQELEDELGFEEMKDGALIEGGSVAEMVANAQPYKFIGDNIFTNETVRRSILANGIALTSQGIPFIHAGEEMLRTKYGDHNSYKSPDEINMIRWELKDQFEPVFDYYAGLIELRKNHPAFTMDSAGEVNRHFKEFKSDQNIVGYTLSEYANGDSYKNIAVIYNANPVPANVKLPSVADWKVIVNDVKAGTEVLGTFKNTNMVTVAPLSMMILYDEQREYQQVPTEIKVNEDFVGLGIDDSHVFDVTIRDQFGVDMNIAPTITAENTEIVDIDGQKIVGSSIGDTALTFKAGEASTTVDVKVVDELIPSKVEIIAPAPSVHVDFNVSLTADVKDQFNQPMSGQHVTWGSDTPKLATIGVDGTVTGLTEGTAIITASINNIEAAIDLAVVPYEKRYIQLEYFRPAGDYEGWNLWVWNTGAKNDRIDFTTTPEGKRVANIEIGPITESIGFIVRQSIDGNDWAQKDIDADRSLYAPKDQTITKVKVNQGQIEVETIE